VVKETVMVEQGGDPEPVDVTYFAADGARIIFMPFRHTADEVAAEREFYDGVLFKDQNAVGNSKVSMSGFDGYKSLVSFTDARYTLYKRFDGGEYLVARTEINASSTDALLRGESILSEMLETVEVGVNVSP
jgi:hypothetical protein